MTYSSQMKALSVIPVNSYGRTCPGTADFTLIQIGIRLLWAGKVILKLQICVVDLETPFAAVQLISVDWDFISQTRNLLLVTAARVANTGMQWLDDSRHSLGDRWGSAPTHIEPVKGIVLLRGLTGARSLRLQALDGRGQPMGDPQFFELLHDDFSIELDGAAPTLWYHLLIER